MSRWVTRPGVHVDRAACAWLIRRFVDPDAQFCFVDDPAHCPPGATPFDLRGAVLGHREGRCSFESALVEFALADPALEALGEIVHEADLADERYDAPAAPGLDLIVRGLSAVCADDHETLSHTDRVFEGLYQMLRRALLTGRPPG